MHKLDWFSTCGSYFSFSRYIYTNLLCDDVLPRSTDQCSEVYRWILQNLNLEQLLLELAVEMIVENCRRMILHFKQPVFLAYSSFLQQTADLCLAAHKNIYLISVQLNC